MGYAWLLVSGAIACMAPAQPPGGAPGERAPGMAEDRPGVFDRDAIKARLTRRLEDMDRQRERMRKALERLEKGDEPGEVMREMGGPLGRRAGEGPRTEGMRGDRPRPSDGPEGPRGDGMRTDRPRASEGPEGPRGDGMRGDRPRPSDGPEGPRGDRRGGPDAPGDGDVMAVLREAMPELAERIERARAEHPQEADAMMRRWGARVRELIPLRRQDPEMFQLRASEMRGGFHLMEAAREARRLKDAAHDAEPEIAAKRDEATAKVRAAAEKFLDARVAMLEKDISAIEGRLKELRERLDETRSNRAKRVDDAVERALRAGRGRDEPGHEGRAPDRGP